MTVKYNKCCLFLWFRSSTRNPDSFIISVYPLSIRLTCIVKHLSRWYFEQLYELVTPTKLRNKNSNKKKFRVPSVQCDQGLFFLFICISHRRGYRSIVFLLFFEVLCIIFWYRDPLIKLCRVIIVRVKCPQPLLA